MVYIRGDDPSLDFLIFDRLENKKFRARVAACNCCGGEIEEGEDALEWDSGDLILCSDCVKEFFKPLKHESRIHYEY